MMINTGLTSRVFVRNDYVLIGPTIPKLAVSLVPPVPTSAPVAKLEIQLLEQLRLLVQVTR
jgi:hypothetical protein